MIGSGTNDVLKWLWSYLLYHPRDFGATRRAGLRLGFRALARELARDLGDQAYSFMSILEPSMGTPSVASKRRCRLACGSGIVTLPPAPITRCQGMPRPFGVAAMAKPTARAPPRRRRALASSP